MLLVAFLGGLPIVSGAQSAGTTHSLVVFPFENTSKVPGIEWIGDSFPELLGARLAGPDVYVLPRETRLLAFERLGIPSTLRPSRPTMYRLAQQMGADYAILGHYDFDGRTFTAAAQLLDLNQDRLFAETRQSGALVDLVTIQTTLAWDLLSRLAPGRAANRQRFLASAPPVRLDALEHYVRGTLATDPGEKAALLREAVRISPSYADALLLLGKTLLQQRDYTEAASWLGRVPEGQPQWREANFYLGLAAYSLHDFARAESAFQMVAAKLPLTEVYNNLGVVAARRGEATALEYFQKSVDADPSDADYRFNLALALYKRGDTAGATRQLREAQQARPNDAEIKALKETLGREQDSVAAAAVRSKLPQERIRTNYDESSFRQVAAALQSVIEQKLARSDPATHARFHSDRGMELLNQGFEAESERDFREALQLDPGNAEAHAGMARILEDRNDGPGARAEAEASLRLKPMAEAYLVLARLDLRENRLDAAAGSVTDALRLEPANGDALALQRAVAAKLAEKAQPLPNR